jgi:hypothetical protein
MNLRQRGHGGDVVLVVGFAFQDERAARGGKSPCCTAVRR